MIGFRIFPLEKRIDEQWVENFKKIPVANVSDVMARMSAGGINLRPMHAGGALAGPAFTVKTRPGDNLMVHKALSMAAPGDVVVVDAGGDLTNAIIGEIMTATAERRKLGGIVIHGAIRDAESIRKSNFPIYAGGVTHRGPYKDGPGEINVPISLNGMVVQPGDLILGDEDGLLCVPMDCVAQIHKAAKAKHEIEEQMLADIAADRLDTAWIDQALARLNCEIIA